ncbi:hypothetical protein NQZ68_027954 [Dissostichus eleginoides]|nr:hypothetical protein NQZ68_027954 [Dissostichus eleginoides]
MPRITMKQLLRPALPAREELSRFQSFYPGLKSPYRNAHSPLPCHRSQTEMPVLAAPVLHTVSAVLSACRTDVTWTTRDRPIKTGELSQRREQPAWNQLERRLVRRAFSSAVCRLQWALRQTSAAHMDEASQTT